MASKSCTFSTLFGRLLDLLKSFYVYGLKVDNLVQVSHCRFKWSGRGYFDRQRDGFLDSFSL